MGAFLDTILEFRAETDSRNTAVLRLAAQALANDITNPRAKGGKMPVDTGFLRNSFQAQLNDNQFTALNPKTDTEVNYNPSAVSLIINKMELGDILYFAFTAEYARRLEYGFHGKDSLGRRYHNPPMAFVRSYAAWWQLYVDDAAKTLNVSSSRVSSS